MTSPAPPAQALTARTIAEIFGVRAIVRTDPVTGAAGVTPLVRDEDLAAAQGRLPIGLVCGSGSGASLMRRLTRSGYRVEAGALNLGDVDRAVAEALGVSRVDVPAFGDVDPAAEERVRAAYEGCAAVVVCDTPFGRANLPNLRAAIAALDAGVPLLLMGEIDDTRDFAGGEAKQLYAAALLLGAARVDAEADAFGALLRLSGTED